MSIIIVSLILFCQLTLADKENPAEVICQRHDITGIGDLKEVLSLRKINLSFNPIGNLKNIDQLKELRHLAAYCCRITNIDHLSGYVGYNHTHTHLLLF
jgi:hypothetical protein